MTDYPPQDPLEAKHAYERALQYQGQPTFGDELEAARVRLHLPKEATAWQIMNAAAAAEREARTFLEALFGMR